MTSLTSRRDFIRVKEEGRSFVSTAFVLGRAELQTRKVRVGYVVTRRLGTACTRNRVKRRLREAFRAVSMPEGDYVVVGRAASKSMPFEEIKFLLEKGGKKLSAKRP